MDTDLPFALSPEWEERTMELADGTRGFMLGTTPCPCGAIATYYFQMERMPCDRIGAISFWTTCSATKQHTEQDAYQGFIVREDVTGRELKAWKGHIFMLLDWNYTLEINGILRGSFISKVDFMKELEDTADKFFTDVFVPPQEPAKGSFTVRPMANTTKYVECICGHPLCSMLCTAATE